MIKKFVVVLKYLGVTSGVLMGVISCENDFRNVGVNIVDNNIFSTDSYISEVKAYSRDIERNQTNTLEYYLLGVQKDEIFGKLETSIVSQLSLPETNPDFGTNAVIDTVIIDIPYLAILDGTQTGIDGNNVPKFVLDSIWSTGDKSFQLNVFELGTYLSNLDPEDPTEIKKYYSDDNFFKTNPNSPLYSSLFTPNPNDTMLLVKRFKYPNYPDLLVKEVYQVDSIKKTILSPSIKITLDNNEIKTIFQDNSEGSEFASNANFQHFFRGLYFEALENNSENASLLTLKMTDATMNIYYSNDVEVDEAEDEDLDGNDITGEENVIVRKPNSFTFPLSGVKANLYARDYSESTVESFTDNPNQTIGEEKIFVQGAAGTDAIIELFGEDANSNDIPDELEILRGKNWLVNDAQLIFYIDSDNITNWTPERLYIYNLGKEEEEDTQLIDALPQSLGNLEGTLQRNTEGNPEKYIFHITEFISEIIESDSELDLYNLGLKVYSIYDLPNQQITTDTILKKYNTNPKGLVLKGNFPSSEENRIKLVIYYSEKN